MTIGPVNYIRQYQLNFNLIEESKINSFYRADNSLDLNNTKKDCLLQPYRAKSILNIKLPMQLTVKLSKNKFYHHKSSCKLENRLKTVFAIIFVYLVC